MGILTMFDTNRPHNLTLVPREGPTMWIDDWTQMDHKGISTRARRIYMCTIHESDKSKMIGNFGKRPSKDLRNLAVFLGISAFLLLVSPSAYANSQLLFLKFACPAIKTIDHGIYYLQAIMVAIFVFIILLFAIPRFLPKHNMIFLMHTSFFGYRKIHLLAILGIFTFLIFEFFDRWISQYDAVCSG